MNTIDECDDRGWCGDIQLMIEWWIQCMNTIIMTVIDPILLKILATYKINIYLEILH